MAAQSAALLTFDNVYQIAIDQYRRAGNEMVQVINLLSKQLNRIATQVDINGQQHTNTPVISQPSHSLVILSIAYISISRTLAGIIAQGQASTHPSKPCAK
ncbi:hypothetical protein O9992_21085 [Vibrio lentus]|nr:hypothetical protein [Vibrio lentus]